MTDRSVPVVLVQGEFIHDQAPYAFHRKVTMQVLQASMIDLLDGMPVQAG